MAEARRVLVLCVDHDDDVGVKVGTDTPIVGRARNLTVAVELSLMDPEESDANAIFGALRTYDQLAQSAPGEVYEVATIVGARDGGVAADRRLTAQLTDVLRGFPAEGVVLVTDGYSDETVIPIIQSRLPIVSVQRVVVKHSESLEESWAVLARYARMVVEEPRYARWMLGAPGILLIVLAVFWTIDPRYVGVVFLFVLGGLLVTGGFRLDEKLGDLLVPSPPNLIRLITVAMTILILGVDLNQMYQGIADVYGPVTAWWPRLGAVVGLGLTLGVDLAVIAACTFLVGFNLYFYFLRDERFWWTIVGLVPSMWMREVILLTARIFQASPAMSFNPFENPWLQGLLVAIGLGIASTALALVVTRLLSHRFHAHFVKAPDDTTG